MGLQELYYGNRVEPRKPHSSLTGHECGFYVVFNQKIRSEKMSRLLISLPDGAMKEMRQGATIEEVAASISLGLKKKGYALTLISAARR